MNVGGRASESSGNIICIFIFIVFFQSVSRAILRGCGKQSVGTLVAFISYYIVALPVGVPLMLLTSFGMTGEEV